MADDALATQFARLQQKVEHIDFEVRQVRNEINLRLPTVSVINRIQEQYDRQDDLLRSIDKHVSGMRERMEDHTGRITIIEGSMKGQTSWSSRATGVWVGVGLTLAALSSIATMIKSFLPK